MEVPQVGLPTVHRSRIEKSIENHLIDGKPEVKDGLCIFRFKPDTALTEENISQSRSQFKDEVWNLAINSNAVIFDLSNAHFIDDSVLGLFVGLNDLFQANDVKLGFSGIQPNVLESIRIKQFNKTLLIREAEEQLTSLFQKESLQRVQPRSFRELSDLQELDKPTKATYDAQTLFHKPKELKKLPEIVSVDRGGETVTISFPQEVSLHSDQDVEGLESFKSFVLGLVGEASSVIIDFQNVTNMAKEVAFALVNLNKSKKLAIRGLSEKPYGVISSMKLHKVLNIVKA